MSKKLKILMVAPQFYPMTGGYEIAALRLSRALVQRGHTVEVVTEQRNKKWKKYEVLDGVIINRIFSVYKKKIHQLSFNSSLISFLLVRGRKFDVFHLHQYGLTSAIVILVAKLMKKKVVLKTTSTGSMGIMNVFNDYKVKNMLEKSFYGIDGFIATSKSAVNEIKKIGISQDKIFMIPNGVDENIFIPLSLEEKIAIREKLKLNRDVFTAIYCGRLSNAKNPLGVIDAWKKVLDKIPSAILLIVGDGEEKEKFLEKIKKYKLNENIIFWGLQENTVKYYQVSDIFLLPSKMEGLSNAMLEALSCGLPVVSTKVSGSIDILEQYNSGKIVNIDDMESFADEIIYLYYNRKERILMGKNARKFISDNISLSSVAEKTEKLYFKLLFD